MDSVQIDRWEVKAWNELSPQEIHEMLKLRIDVFVVEQACAYEELDGLDLKCMHVIGKNDEGKVVATARVAPMGLIYDLTSIGRVAVSKNYRMSGNGRVLMEKSMEYIKTNMGESSIKIAAQQYLRSFYESLGYERVSEPYPWDGIPHIDMIFNAEE